jgi:hypothetical protein
MQSGHCRSLVRSVSNPGLFCNVLLVLQYRESLRCQPMYYRLCGFIPASKHGMRSKALRHKSFALTWSIQKYYEWSCAILGRVRLSITCGTCERSKWHKSEDVASAASMTYSCLTVDPFTLRAWRPYYHAQTLYDCGLKGKPNLTRPLLLPGGQP